MSNTTAALEAAVATVIANLPKDGEAQTNRQRVHGDRAFAHVLKILAPRIRHFIRQYGLAGHWDDAEQCCAIGVHRAIQAYDSERAQFTTFVNWQLRGELQSLRFRLMTDQRPSAKKVEASTVSLHAVTSGADGESNTLESMIEDEFALDRTEACAGDHLAVKTREALLDAYVDHLRGVAMEQMKRRARSNRSVQVLDPRLPRFRAGAAIIDPAEIAELEERLEAQRQIVARRLSDDMPDESELDPQERERQRQVAKRAAKTIAEIAANDPRFGGMFERPRPKARRRVTDKPTPIVTVLPDHSAPHNQLSRVIAVAAAPLATVEAEDQGEQLMAMPRGVRSH
ncbi:sigma-70 family RNA polymerase sigma factor [Sphingomonas suaedae]|uniref:sigma-70 family RNA polymerase sigma factor n=1 Tax=Sphingomonas suaedae TaxID=2599297 RepID=UPI0016477B37|nr:sigma-70 family RNA polymerase sigma factor [Sphingomonas suaedae]